MVPRITLEEAQALDTLASLDSDAPVLERRSSGAESLPYGGDEVGFPACQITTSRMVAVAPLGKVVSWGQTDRQPSLHLTLESSGSCHLENSGRVWRVVASPRSYILNPKKPGKSPVRLICFLHLPLPQPHICSKSWATEERQQEGWVTVGKYL